MYLLKLSISFFKRLCLSSALALGSSILLLAAGLAGCSHVYTLGSTLNYTKLVYVNLIPNSDGMFMVSSLRTYFPTKTPTEYTLNFRMSYSESLQLSDNYGFASQNALIITYTWSLVDNKTHRVLRTEQDYRNAYYKLSPSAYATTNSKIIATHLALQFISRDIFFKIVALLREVKTKQEGPSSSLLQNNLHQVAPTDLHQPIPIGTETHFSEDTPESPHELPHSSDSPTKSSSHPTRRASKKH